jgi:hypothetical protein
MRSHSRRMYADRLAKRALALRHRSSRWASASRCSCRLFAPRATISSPNSISSSSRCASRRFSRAGDCANSASRCSTSGDSAKARYSPARLGKASARRCSPVRARSGSGVRAQAVSSAGRIASNARRSSGGASARLALSARYARAGSAKPSDCRTLSQTTAPSSVPRRGIPDTIPSVCDPPTPVPSPPLSRGERVGVRGDSRDFPIRRK